jgi:hypothetical protein
MLTKIKMVVQLICLASIGSPALLGQSLGAVSVSLHPPQDSFKLGEPIILNLTTYNSLDKNVSIGVSPGISDATYNCHAHIKMVRSNSTNKEDDGLEKINKRHTRSAFGYTLTPKSSLKRTYLLTNRYELNLPDIYKVYLSCFYFDGATSIQFNSNTVEITVDQK